jgi:hypothetical protein
MTDCQQLVDEIRSFLQSTDMTMTDRLKELATRYAEACQEANQRLRRCEEFLRKGLRAEAIHFAQAEPALLDVVGTLDFPEQTALRDTLIFYGMPEPPRLLVETAESLNQAYAEEQPLEDLMRRHRRLALLRAPVVARLKVMRQVAKLDKNNTVWEDDIREFEAARFREIQAEVTGPSKEDAARMAEIAAELAQTAWLNPPPAALAADVGHLAGRLARDQARAALEDVVGQLNAAMATSDVPRAQDLRQRYGRLMDEAKLSANDSLVRHAARPLNWLAKAERLEAAELDFQTAQAALEDALDREADPEEVTRLYHAALNLGRGLEKRLDQRYHQYVSRADSARRWREKVILLSVFLAGFIVILGIIGYLWLRAWTRPAAPAAGERPAALRTL